MMGKINTQKVRTFDPIRVEAHTEVKKTGKEMATPIKVSPPENEDKVNFSMRASEVGKLVEQIKVMPDVRSEKVKMLRDRISADNFKPSGDDIADSILKDERM